GCAILLAFSSFLLSVTRVVNFVRFWASYLIIAGALEPLLYFWYPIYGNPSSWDGGILLAKHGFHAMPLSLLWGGAACAGLIIVLVGEYAGHREVMQGPLVKRRRRHHMPPGGYKNRFQEMLTDHSDW